MYFYDSVVELICISCLGVLIRNVILVVFEHGNKYIIIMFCLYVLGFFVCLFVCLFAWGFLFVCLLVCFSFFLVFICIVQRR